MRILYLKTDLHNGPLIAGGSVAHMVGVLQGFLELGHEVTVATSVVMPYLATMKLKNIHYLGNPRWLVFLRWKLNCLLSTFFFLPVVWKIVKSEKPDFIYQRYSPFNMTGILVSGLKKTPLVLEFNGSEVWATCHWGGKSGTSIGMRVMRCCELFILARATKIIVVSEILKQQLLDLGIEDKKIIIVPNGVDTEIFNPEKLYTVRCSYRTRWSQESNPFVFGFVGTFGPWHGIEVLRDMIIAIVKQRKAVHFLLIGDGILKDTLDDDLREAGIGPKYVTFTGLVSPEQARDFLAACDAFLCPTQPNSDGSRFFGSPTKLFEYLSMGRPVIASRLEQLEDVVFPAFMAGNASRCVDREVGFLVDPGDCDGFLSAARALVDMSAEQRNRMGMNARAKAIREYTWVGHAKKILAQCDD